MSQPNSKINLIFILLFFLEILFRSSGSDFLYNIELLIPTIIIYQEFKIRDRFAYYLFLFLTMFVESVNFELVGLRGFVFTFLYLFINALENFVKILQRNTQVKGVFLLIAILILIQISRDIYYGFEININFLSIIVNIVLYIIIYKIVNKFSPSRYAV